MTRNIDVEPGESVQPRMSRGRWEIDAVAVGAPRTVRVDTVTESDLWLKTETGEIYVSDSALARCECGQLVALGGVCWRCGECEAAEIDGVDVVEDRVSESMRAADGYWQEEQEYRELNELKTSRVLL
ncbi:hypothetical protein [Halomicrobium urmianum]|uniref:hypothetical protein n=1 Tax=Halomicrobium urmianum TaxID=1586233 RepID=UPI001CD95D72|nr:hypothetical protein [Halomicrobium urmianum]